MCGQAALRIAALAAAVPAACAIEARSFTPEHDPAIEVCSTPGDEDGNGLADCHDPACAAEPACQPPCGNGVLDPGELCDDGNAVSGDGCDANCQVEPFHTIAPHAIGRGVCRTSGGLRRIAVDERGVIYAVLFCGSNAAVLVSTDLGRSFSEPRDVSSDLPGASMGLRGTVVAAGPGGIAYVGIVSGDSILYVRATQDSGRTWTAGIPVGMVGSGPAGLALQAFDDDVYAGLPAGDGVVVAHNHTRGIGPFDTTQLTVTNFFFDLMFDGTTGLLVEAGDRASLVFRVSHDGGATFGDEGGGSGLEYFSSWAFGNGTLYVSGINMSTGGESTRLYVIPVQAEQSVPSVTGLPGLLDRSGGTPSPGRRSLTADAAGNAFIVSGLDNGGVQLDRLSFGAAALDPPRLVSATGYAPAVAPLPGNQGVAVMYGDGLDVWVAIHVY